MKRNLETVMTDIHGKPYDDVTTLGKICLLAFQTPARSDEALTGPEKLAQYVLATKLVKGGTVDLSAEDITLIKDRLAKTIQALAYGRACELLEADPEPDAAQPAGHLIG